MIFHDRRLSLSEIDRDDERYRITTERENGDLIRSIRRLGLLSPPILMARHPGGYAIVAGFRRVDACCALKMSDVPVRVLETGAAALTCAELAVSDNVFQRELNLLEQARALTILEPFCSNRSALSKTAKALHLPFNFDMMDKLLRLDRLSSKLKDGVREAVLPLSIALELADLPPDESELMTELFFMLRPGLNKQREIMTLIREIAAREDACIKAVLTLPDVLAILENENTDRNVKTGALRKYLKKRRYPAITQAEAEFKQFVKKLELGKEAQLIPPRDFEGTEYTLSLKFSDPASLEAHQKTIRQILENLPGNQFYL